MRLFTDMWFACVLPIVCIASLVSNVCCARVLYRMQHVRTIYRLLFVKALVNVGFLLIRLGKHSVDLLSRFAAADIVAGIVGPSPPSQSQHIIVNKPLYEFYMCAVVGRTLSQTDLLVELLISAIRLRLLATATVFQQQQHQRTHQPQLQATLGLSVHQFAHRHHSMRQTVNALVKLACVVSLLAYSPDMFVESIGSWRILDTVRTVVPRALLLLLLIALNGLIYWRLSDRVSQTRRISGREHVRHGAIRFNRMVLAQSMLFVMGNLPWLCVSLARSIQQHNASSDPIADPLLDSVVELPLLVSLGISSFVYFVLDKRFRSETVHLIAGMRATASVAPL